ncbi:MAG TPA: DUF5947 family protein [Solirubrobacteraceae bacterium]|nr:DUF5947 family protein [Solirubrobacteraceae bacterium]
MTGHRPLPDAMAARRRAELVSGLRGLTRPRTGSAGAAGATGVAADPPPATAPAAEACDLCGVGIAADHRHLLHLGERRIVCACEACWAMRSGEGDYRPTGNRTVWLSGLDVPADLWAGFQIPIGLAFFMESTVTGCIVAMYPSPGGATESELHFESWNRMRELNPVLETLEPDIEGLIANRLCDPPIYVIAPIDRCYELTGTVKAAWEGISGGSGVEVAVDGFFDTLRVAAGV